MSRDPESDLHVAFAAHLFKLLESYGVFMDLDIIAAHLLSWSVYLTIEDSKSYEEAIEKIDQMVSQSFRAFGRDDAE